MSTRDFADIAMAVAFMDGLAIQQVIDYKQEAGVVQWQNVSFQIYESAHFTLIPYKSDKHKQKNSFKGETRQFHL